MNIQEIISAVLALIVALGGGSWLTARVTSKRNNAQSETEARAQYAAEFDILAKNLADEIKRQDEKLERQDTKIGVLEQTVGTQGEKILRLERRESSFRAYIHRLIAQIRGLGAEPVEPPEELEL